MAMSGKMASMTQRHKQLFLYLKKAKHSVQTKKTFDLETDRSPGSLTASVDNTCFLTCGKCAIIRKEE